MRALALALFLLFAASCAAISEPPVEGWPELQIVWHQVSQEEVHGYCAIRVGPIPVGARILGCATADFDRRECHIYVTEDAAAWVIEHERLHCLGWDHPGENTMRDGWRKWRERHAR